MYIDLEKVGAHIKKKRLKRGWTIQYLAEQCHYSAQHIGNIERGQARASVDAFMVISEILDTPPQHLLFFKEDRPKQYIIDEIDQKLSHSNVDQLRLVSDIVEMIVDYWEQMGNGEC